MPMYSNTVVYTVKKTTVDSTAQLHLITTDSEGPEYIYVHHWLHSLTDAAGEDGNKLGGIIGK